MADEPLAAGDAEDGGGLHAALAPDMRFSSMVSSSFQSWYADPIPAKGEAFAHCRRLHAWGVTLLAEALVVCWRPDGARAGMLVAGHDPALGADEGGGVDLLFSTNPQNRPPTRVLALDDESTSSTAGQVGESERAARDDRVGSLAKRSMRGMWWHC